MLAIAGRGQLLMTQWCIVIGWQSPDVDFWIYGPYDHEPTQHEQIAARSNFMDNTTTSDNDWDEYGCSLQLRSLLTPPQEAT